MKLFKNYVSKKELRNRLNIQMENNKMFNNKVIRLSNENVEYQNELQEIKLYITKLHIEIEDLKGFREQDKECIKALKKERTSLKTKLTKMEKRSESGPQMIIEARKVTEKEMEKIKQDLEKQDPIYFSSSDESKVEFLKTSKRGKRDGK